MEMEIDRTLLTSQTDIIFSILAEDGMRGEQFEWDEELVQQDDLGHTAARISVLKYRGRDFYMSIHPRTRLHKIRYSPGDVARTEILTLEYWSEVETHVRQWVKCLKRELGAVDYWSDVAKWSRPLEATDAFSPDHEAFTNQQATQLKEAVGRVKGQTEGSLTLDPDQLASLHEKLDQIIEAVGQSKPFHWRNLFMNSVFQLATEELWDPENWPRFWSLVTDALRGIGLLPSP